MWQTPKTNKTSRCHHQRHSFHFFITHHGHVQGLPTGAKNAFRRPYTRCVVISGAASSVTKCAASISITVLASMADARARLDEGVTTLSCLPITTSFTIDSQRRSARAKCDGSECDRTTKKWPRNVDEVGEGLDVVVTVVTLLLLCCWCWGGGEFGVVEWSLWWWVWPHVEEDDNDDNDDDDDGVVVVVFVGKLLPSLLLLLSSFSLLSLPSLPHNAPAVVDPNDVDNADDLIISLSSSCCICCIKSFPVYLAW